MLIHNTHALYFLLHMLPILPLLPFLLLLPMLNQDPAQRAHTIVVYKIVYIQQFIIYF